MGRDPSAWSPLGTYEATGVSDSGAVAGAGGATMGWCPAFNVRDGCPGAVLGCVAFDLPLGDDGFCRVSSGWNGWVRWTRLEGSSCNGK